MRELTELQQVIQSIGQFYLQKNNGDGKKANEEIDNLKITRIEMPEDEQFKWLTGEVVITAMRIGLLIGKRGENIELLSKYLNRKVKAVEDMDLNLLTVYENVYENESQQEFLDGYGETEANYCGGY